MFKQYKWYWGVALFISALTLAARQETLEAGPSITNPATAIPKILPNSFLNNFDGVDLVDQHGHSFQPAGLVNHVVLFNFIFTACSSTCPMQTRILAQAFQELPADVRSQVRFVSVSIDPGNDTPGKLHRFSKTMGADLEGWSFLTGDAGHVEQLTQRLHIFDESETGQANRPQIHRTSLWLVDKQGRMLQRYRGDPPDKERLIRELAQVSRMTIH